MRRRWLAAVAALAVVALVAAAALRDRSGARAEPAVSVATVARRDLVTRESFAGSLGYVDIGRLVDRLAGTITALPAEGAVVRRGGVLYRVDATPVVLLYGRLPAWRPLREGVSGPDVRQLERNLRALGFGRVVADGAFDAATTAAVRVWQRRRGVRATGSLPLGTVAFLPGPRRVGAVRAALGAPARPGAAVLTTSSLRRVASVRLPAAQQELAALGERVMVALPTGRTVPGRIAEIGKVATAAQNEPPSVTVQVSVGGAADALDQAPVTVAIEAERKRAAIAVPVQALLALQGGGYALEVFGEHGRRLVRVRLGTFADGYVEVAGAGVHPGVRVSSAE